MGDPRQRREVQSRGHADQRGHRADAEGFLRVSIADAGTGMDAETAEQAFDQFFRADRARKLAPDGSGVGLYAANGLMQAMGGGIDIETRLGAGTTMTLRVPAESADQPGE